MEYPTQEYLLENFSYNPDTGHITRKRSCGGKSAGSRAGYKNRKGYRRIHIKGKEYQEHRIAWVMVNGGDRIDQIDHINHVRDDNRLCNLRSVDQYENQKNTTLRKDNSSGFTGVSWCKIRCKFVSRIQYKKEVIRLGAYDTLIDAVAARKKANIEYGFHKNHGML